MATCPRPEGDGQACSKEQSAGRLDDGSVSALSNTVLLVTVRLAEGDADCVLRNIRSKVTGLLRNELATIVGTDLRRAPDLLDEKLDHRLAG